MNNVEYNMQVYNDFYDFPLAMTSIQNFEFDKLLFHPNPKVRKFNFIVITKCITKENTTTVQPIVIIYDKSSWKITSEKGKESSIRIHCSNEKEALDFAGNLIKIPCNSQEGIINWFHIISRMLIVRNNIRGKVRVRSKQKL